MSEKYEISLDGAEWRTSTFTGTDGSSNCVEVAALPNGHVAVRDTKDRERGSLVFTPGEWAAFRAGMEAGEFNDLGKS